MKDKRREILLKKKARKAARMNNPGAKSKYQRKITRKCGRGSVSPRWQWWMERAATEAKAA